MKNKFLGKVISAILALVLVIAMVPVTFATDTATDFNYVFNNAAHALPANPTGAQRALTSGLHTIGTTDTTVSDSWGFVNAYGYAGLATLPDKLNWEMLDENKDGVVFAPGLGSGSVLGRRAALAFEIVAEEGVFDASLSALRTRTSTQLEVYLLPKSKVDDDSWEYAWEYTNSASQTNFYSNIMNMSANYRIGKIELYGNESKAEDIYIGRVELTEKNYYLVLVPCGVNKDAVLNTNNRWQLALTGFKLDAVGGAAEPNVETFDPAAAFTSAYRSVGGYNSSTNTTGTFSATEIQVRRYAVTTANGPFAAFKVNVDVSGDYNLSFKTDRKLENAAAPAVYLSEMSSDKLTDKWLQKVTDKTLYGYFDFSKLNADTYATVTADGLSDGAASVLPLDANNDYYIILATDATSFELNDVVFEKSSNSNVSLIEKGYAPVSGGGVKKDNVLLGMENYQEFHISGIKLTQVVKPSEEDEKRAAAYTADRELYNTLTSVTADNNTKNTLDSYSSTATVTIVAQDITTGGSVVDDIINENVAVNTEYKLIAPTVSDDYEFMYWAIGLGVNRKIVSFDKDEYAFTVAPGRNLVYAVYRKINNDTKYAFFFDGSRTVMGKKTIADAAITLPKLPGAMPGFGNPIGWKYTGEEDEEALPETAVVEDLDDDSFFVAAYNDRQIVKITIDGETIEVPYGEEVNLGNYASLRENISGENVFNYWKKGDEIISFSPAYTFLAYEDCTLTSTYAKYEPTDKTIRRILVSADSETGITFAEFIGLDSAIEKGIIFGNDYASACAKAVMQSSGNIFSVVNKTGEKAIGYAILKDGSIVYSDR